MSQKPTSSKGLEFSVRALDRLFLRVSRFSIPRVESSRIMFLGLDKHKHLGEPRTVNVHVEY